jgi:DNA-binding protein YbaB
LNRRQAAWDEERQQFQEQLERLQAERRALREQAAATGLQAPSIHPADSGEPGASDLRQQLEQAQHECKALEEKLAARNRQAERERGALEAEIEQLMERQLRMYHERNG